jgi:hypothetical protein
MLDAKDKHRILLGNSKKKGVILKNENNFKDGCNGNKV